MLCNIVLAVIENENDLLPEKMNPFPKLNRSHKIYKKKKYKIEP